MKRTLRGRVAVVGLPLAAFLAFLAQFKSDYGMSGIFDLLGLVFVWILFFVAPGVLFLLVRACLRWALRGTGPLRIFPKVPLRYSLAFREFRPAATHPQLPNFGMYWGWILMALMIILWIITPRAPTGLLVRVPSRYIAARPRAPESESLGVYVAVGGRYYVNGQLVARDQLRSRLEQELGRRSFWIVYFEGDEDVGYGQVVYAVDTIRGLGAQAYFLSPRIRADFNQPQNLTKR